MGKFSKKVSELRFRVGCLTFKVGCLTKRVGTPTPEGGGNGCNELEIKNLY